MSSGAWLLLLLGVALALAFLRRLSAPGFFAANHRASALLAGLAGTAMGLSAFVFVGGPALTAQVGSGALWIILPAPLTAVLQCWVLGGWILSQQPRVLSIPELLGRRLGSGVRLVASALLACGCLAGLAVQGKAVAVLASGLWGGDGTLWAFAVLCATVAYMAAGGMRAGLVVDAVQGGLMGLVALILATAALVHAGEAVGQVVLHPTPLLSSFGQVAPAQAFSWYLLFTLGTLAQPHYLQKFLLLRSRHELRSFPWVLTASLMVVLAVWLGLGLASLALVQRGDLPTGLGDAVIPQLLRQLGPWAVTAAALGVLAAIMSTVASFCNLLAAAVAYDLPQALGKAPWPLGWARGLTVLGGLLGTWIGVSSDRSVAVLGLLGWGFFTASLLPAVLGARFGATCAPAIAAGMVAGAVSCVVLELLRPSFPWPVEPGLFGAAVGLGVVTVAGWRGSSS
ncbi:MAG: hypothetical protein N2447_03065 [Thermoanaerobaculum sp.]|nr:hypothetical protein [Thermoanaerobaculum sp.]